MYLKFELEAEIWHGDSLSSWELVCKILCRWVKAFGHSGMKCTQVPKNEEFFDLFFKIFKVFFMSFSLRSAIKFDIQVNMCMLICSQWCLDFFEIFFQEIAMFYDFCKFLKNDFLNFCPFHPNWLRTWSTLFFLLWAILKGVPVQNFRHVTQNLSVLWLKNQNFAILDLFSGFSSQKINFVIWFKSCNLAQICP